MRFMLYTISLIVVVTMSLGGSTVALQHLPLASGEGLLSLTLPKGDTPYIVAHRGASAYAPENTMAAFHKAEAQGAHYIELDLHASKDGRLVVIHDTTVNRTTNGKGRVRSMTLDELRELDAGYKFAENYRGEKIPTLDEVLDEFAGRIGLLIEIKTPSLYPGIENKVAGALTERGLHTLSDGSIIVQSFDPASLKRMKMLLPQIPVAILTDRTKHLSTSALLEHREYADAIHPRVNGLSKELVSRIHDYGMSVITWTVNRPSQIRMAAGTGVDGIITDYPDIASDIVTRLPFWSEW